ncbi:MAG: pyruvate kinase [Candidatus Gastranaerophilales bacterium]|nr:pyruvate kinase [Candidatus Gastranaerophilales bacterium]
MKNLTSTKIIATCGPSADTKEQIKVLVEAGVSMFRLNSSHADEAEHLNRIKHIREIEKEIGYPIPILLDLQGPKIRVGLLDEPIELIKPSIIKLRHQDKYENGIIPVDYEGMAKDVSVSEKIFLDDGKLVLEVVKIDGDVIQAKVLCGGLLRQRKGINIPGSQGSLKVLTERDKQFVKFAIDNELDYLGLSFVRDENDVMELRELIKEYNGKIKIISKIEKPQALKNIDEIITRSAGIMVARGDLGIEISPEKVPIVQKEIIKKANAQRKAVIVATQMLESMVEQPIPTRAEASDVANAIIDGTDAIMLSGETATGMYPTEAVKMMKSIAQNVESSKIMRHNYYPEDLIDVCKDDSIAICTAIIDMVEKIDVKAILTLTASGYTPKLLSKAKPSVPILSFCPSYRNSRRMVLYSDVYPVAMELNEGINQKTLRDLDKCLIERFHLKQGDKVVVTGALPDLLVGKTNFIKLHEVE